MGPATGMRWKALPPALPALLESQHQALRTLTAKDLCTAAAATPKSPHSRAHPRAPPGFSMVDDQDLGRFGVSFRWPKGRPDAPGLCAARPDHLRWRAAVATPPAPLPLHPSPLPACPLQNLLGLAVAALFIVYNYFAAEPPRQQE